jgi:hypothetical protein
MRIDVYHHFPHAGLDPFTQILTEILKMSAQLDALAAAVAANTSVTESAITLLTGLHAKLLELMANCIDPVAVQQLADDLSADTQKLAESVTANTPTP